LLCRVPPGRERVVYSPGRRYRERPQEQERKEAPRIEVDAFGRDVTRRDSLAAPRPKAADKGKDGDRRRSASPDSGDEGSRKRRRTWRDRRGDSEDDVSSDDGSDKDEPEEAKEDTASAKAQPVRPAAGHVRRLFAARLVLASCASLFFSPVFPAASALA